LVSAGLVRGPAARCAESNAGRGIRLETLHHPHDGAAASPADHHDRPAYPRPQTTRTGPAMSPLLHS
jgi:hypothetical protein